jgi:hypothetical protein
MLTRAHEAFYADEIAGLPSSRLLIQPSNQGTAPAILYSLLRLYEMDPKAVVAFFPSDHHFSDDEAFIGHIDSAYATAASRPEMVVLLGIPPEAPEVEYGWIEPGIPLGSPEPDGCFGLDGARLSVEQLRYGGLCSRFSETHPECASKSSRSVRIHSIVVVYGMGENGIVRTLFGYRRHQLFSRCPSRTA